MILKGFLFQPRCLIVERYLQSSPSSMEQRRYKDIIAFKPKEQAPLAFHARNLEVAEISEETWSSLLSEDSASLDAISELEAWNNEVNPDVKSGQVQYGIRSLSINVTQICNLKCTYCAAGGDGTYGAPQTKINVEKTLPQLKYFLDKIPDQGRFRITFIGGEPLIYPDGIQEIANYVNLMSEGRQIEVLYSIVTNGTLINERTLEVLKNIHAKVTVSLDGPSEINDKSRPTKDGSGSTALVLAGLQKLVAIKHQLRAPLTVHGVFNKDHLDVETAYHFYRTLNVDQFEFTFAVQENDQESNSRFVAQMNAIAQFAYAQGGESELRKIALFDQYFSALDNQQQTENHCGAGKSYLMIDAKNNLYTCPWDVGTKTEQVGSGQDLEQEKLATYEAALIEKNNCQTCWARFLCGGGCMYIHKQATGSKSTKDGQFCFRTRALIATTLNYYKLCRTFC